MLLKSLEYTIAKLCTKQLALYIQVQNQKEKYTIH